MINLTEKLKKLKEYILNQNSMVIAFSGGVDSSLLLHVANEVLGDKVLAVTARSSTYPEREYKIAEEFARKIGAKHISIISEELDIKGFSENPKDRCYYCKKELFGKLVEIAKEQGFNVVAEGSNIDDLSDYRPGKKAKEECNVVSPLLEVGLTKAEIREIAKERGIEHWHKPAYACLASRFPYGQKITAEKLRMIEMAEEFLFNSGFLQVRVRNHDGLARIEVSPDERKKFFDEKIMDRVYEEFAKIGFSHTSLDLKGYRTGSMNEEFHKIKNPV